MAKEFTLYAYTFPSRAERVLWTLRELKLDYELTRLNPIDEKGNKNSDLLKINPAGRVPVLVHKDPLQKDALHKDKVLTESLATMEYLAALKQSPNLFPSKENEYNFRQFMYYIVTEIEPYLWTIDQSTRLNMMYQWPEGTSENAARLLTNNLKWLFEKLDNKTCAIGDTFSLADIYAFHTLTWVGFRKIQLPDGVLAYMENQEQRDAIPETMKVLEKIR